MAAVGVARGGAGRAGGWRASGAWAPDVAGVAGEPATPGLQGSGRRLAALTQTRDLAARAPQTRVGTDKSGQGGSPVMYQDAGFVRVRVCELSPLSAGA